MKTAAIVINDPHQQYEGLRVSVGMALEGMAVQMFVLHDRIANMDEAYRDNMIFLDEMGGRRYSNNVENAAHYGFTYVTLAKAARQLRQADIVIPF